MRYFILILCVVQIQVQASDWLNRTVRVDLIVNPNRTAFDPQFDLLERAESFANGVNATNGQYPWSLLTRALSGSASGVRVGTPCSGTIVANNFVLSDFHCVGQDLHPPANTIEAYIGSVQWRSPLSPTNFVRHYWYITPSPQNSPNIVLLRLHEPLTFNPNIQPIRLPSHENFSYDAWSSYILGYPTPSGTFFAYLQSAHASIFNNSLCNFYGSIADHEICGIDGNEPYNGSIRRYTGFTGGAWIVYEYTAGYEFIPVIVGIHQYQFANQTASFGRATRVSEFVEWIETLSLVN